MENPRNTVDLLVPVRIGAVSYLNTKPLIASLTQRLSSRSQLSLDLPSHLASQLDNGSIDVGLIPAIEFFRGPQELDAGNGGALKQYRIVSNACIACRGIVRSVRLFFRVPPHQVQTMAIDEGSKTSIALASILLYERFGIRPEFTPLPIGADPNAATSDAVLVIGDRAMHPERYEGFLDSWDLGQEWYRETGLPFVFAMWVGREAVASRSLATQLEAARDDGVQRIDELSQRYAAGYALSTAECIEYLSVNLRFTLNHDEIQGLKLFYRKSLDLGILHSLPQPIWPIISSSTFHQLVPS